MVDLLIREGARVDEADEAGWTPLMISVGVGEEAILQRLIAAGANVGVVNEAGTSAIHYAVSKNRPGVRPFSFPIGQF